MNKEQLTKDFENLITNAKNFMRVYFISSDRLERQDKPKQSVQRSGRFMRVFFYDTDSDLDISDTISKAIDMATIIEKEESELCIYEKSNPNLYSRFRSMSIRAGIDDPNRI